MGLPGGAGRGFVKIMLQKALTFYLCKYIINSVN